MEKNTQEIDDFNFPTQAMKIHVCYRNVVLFLSGCHKSRRIIPEDALYCSKTIPNVFLR